MAYLTYDEYEDMGGQLPAAAFSMLEFRARKAVDMLTHGRVADEQPVREAVKLAVYALVGEMDADEKRAAAYDGREVQSMSNDGVSVTFASGAQAGAEAVRAQNARYAGLLKSYLAGETTEDGLSLIYAGVGA